MKSLWHTLWQGHDIAVCRDSVEVDRLPAERIERVLLFYRGSGDSPGDVVVVIELTRPRLFSADRHRRPHQFRAPAVLGGARLRPLGHGIARAPLPLRLRPGSGRRSAPPALSARRAGDDVAGLSREVAGGGGADLGRAQAPAHRARPAVALAAAASTRTLCRRRRPASRAATAPHQEKARPRAGFFVRAASDQAGAFAVRAFLAAVMR